MTTYKIWLKIDEVDEMSDILGKVRKLNWLLQESPTGVFSFNEMCSVLSDLMDANIYVANDKGKV